MIALKETLMFLSIGIVLQPPASESLLYFRHHHLIYNLPTSNHYHARQLILMQKQTPGPSARQENGKNLRYNLTRIWSPGCMYLGTIIHEFMHALGIDHEHVRSDRDNYVTILWENIKPDFKDNFEKLSPSEENTFGVPYNVSSIMHYKPTAFSINGQPTIEAKLLCIE
ncbi:hypothetical protein HA402_009005 [Bradysia odoriphaga]|nr:hypothetical protein HA402_009005 [Bradysia odoriphaga]